MKNGEFKMRIQCIWKFKRKFNLEMEIKVYLEIGKKVYENKGNWEIKKLTNGREKSLFWNWKETRNITKIEESRKMKKKK